MTDPDELALFRAIVRHPDDDTVRFVYADWLQENGRVEEGEFVRTQCRLAKVEPDDPEYPALVDRDEELRLWLKTHASGPRTTFPGGLSVDGGPLWWWQAHRGFPRFLEFDGYERYGVKAMRGLASALNRAFESLPTRWLVVRYVTVAQLVALLKQPVLAGLSHLTVQLHAIGDEADAVAEALAKCRHLRNLRGLSLASGFGDAGCESLASAHWGELEWFSPACHAIGAEGLRAMAGADWFRGLRELRLDDGLAEDSFEALVRLPALARLHTLDLSHDDFSEAAWLAFSRSRAFPAITKLVCDDGNFAGTRASSLVSATGFALSSLSLARCGAESAITEGLARAPWASSLRSLNLLQSALAPSEVRTLTDCKRFTNLQHLDLSGNTVGPTALSALAANPALRGVRTLQLAYPFNYPSGLTPAHFDKFLAKLNMPDLRHLDLTGCPVGATAAKKLASPKFASLTRLALKGCKLSDTAVAALIGSPALRNLIQLDLSDNGLKTGPKKLGDPSVLPNLAACSLGGNPIAALVARKLRVRPGVFGLPKAAKRRA